ncbi:MAG: protein kinase [Candidatus Acidiferrales bacterium]
MVLASATKLGPYEIVSPLGAGGMGEVYRASDTRLDRIVAIKVLPASLADNADRLHRFEQEARVLSTLNHPNLLAIHDVGEQGGIHYLVSEYLDGETLRERMTAGLLPQRKVSEYALQIANGLAAAHDKGIVHRDLKPENIFITHDDRIKILDFGLAKQSQSIAGLTGDTATLTSPAQTTAGTVMGTVGYMSPEQVRGQVVDARSDIFSLGAILYEMATGKRAFKGDSSVETMNAILKEDPPEIDPAQIKTSPALERIVRHCLEKNPANRFQSARDLAFALSALSGTGSTSAISSPAWPAKRPWLVWTIAGLAVLALIAAAIVSLQHTPQAQRMEFALPLQQDTSHMAISPDGHMLAFVSPDAATGASIISVMQIGASDATPLAGTEGASYPFWSPDDAYVAFFAGGKLKRVPANGGVPQALATASAGRGGSWGKQGIIFSPDAIGWLWKVNADGSGLAPVTDQIFDPSKKEASHRWPVLLPDGDHFLFLAGTFSNDSQSFIYLGSLSQPKQKIVVVAAASPPGYAGGYLFYLDEKRSLRAIRMDKHGKTSGEAQLLVDQVGYQPGPYWAAFSVAENGTVVYNPEIGGGLSVLTWYDRSGKKLGTVGDIGVLGNPTLSPDGSRVVVDIADPKANNVNIWIQDFKGDTSSPFTFDPSEDDDAVWSRDGSSIALRSTVGGDTRIYLKPVRGMAPYKTIFDVHLDGIGAQQNADLVPNSWSLDDKEVLCTLQPVAGGSQLVLIPASGGKMTPFLTSGSTENDGQISPDGKWVAYASNESGDWEIYVTSFPGAAGKWQVSRGGGTEPRWRGDGKEIFYIGPKATMTAVPVSTVGGTFSSGNPASLFQTQLRAPVSSTDLFRYDVSKDGQRFLIDHYTPPAQIIPLRIILNSTAGLQK